MRWLEILKYYHFLTFSIIDVKSEIIESDIPTIPCDIDHLGSQPGEMKNELDKTSEWDLLSQLLTERPEFSCCWVRTRGPFFEQSFWNNRILNLKKKMKKHSTACNAVICWKCYFCQTIFQGVRKRLIENVPTINKIFKSGSSIKYEFVSTITWLVIRLT